MSLSLLVLALSGCVYSTQPLLSEFDSRPDVRLLGSWTQIDPKSGEAATVRISRDPDAPNLLQFAYDNGTPKLTACPITGTLAVAKIGDDHLLSVCRTLADGRGSKHYTAARYEIREERFLGIWPADPKFFKGAVKNGELKGASLFGAVELSDTS